MKLEYCKMVVFKSCRNCTPPKRYPGCHAHCEAYKVERAEYDRLKANFVPTEKGKRYENSKI